MPAELKDDGVRFELRFYSEDNVVFFEGEYGDCMYDIVKGSVYVFKNYRRPGQRLLAQLMPGDYFGEMAILDSMPRNATIVAASDDTMLRLIRDKDFASYAAANPEKAIKIIHSMGAAFKKVCSRYNAAKKFIGMSDECQKSKKKLPPEMLEIQKGILDEYEAEKKAAEGY